MNPLLQATRVTYGTPEGRVLQRGLNFALNPGQLLLIRGANGCGKSTLLKALLGEVSIISGDVLRGFSNDSLQYLPQLENTEVHFPVTLRDVLAISQRKRVSWDRVRELGLLRDEHLNSAWNTASGGERKRTLLTRALLKEPTLLVFDEPMNHLDGDSRGAMIRAMAKFLGQLSEPSGERGIIMVCHQGLSSSERELFDLVELDLDLISEGRVASC